MQLVSPNKHYQTSYLSYLTELDNEIRYPFTLDLPHLDFDALLAQLTDYSQGKNLPKGAVTNTTLWLVDGNEILGVTNVRHYLNPGIKHCGGHIGLSIRPSCRGKGLGKLLMKLSIEYLTTLAVKDIQIHCYKDNISSAKAIIDNGGVLHSEIENDGQLVQRYLLVI